MAQASKTFRVFVSSTFSDLKAERDALQKYVFPRLRELCMRHGCRFQAIDLRWGVSEEASRDQQTMKICLKEIARCQDVTPRPNFIVLLGDRYGWRPLPAEIPAGEFAAIKSRVTTEADLALLERSYRLDMNAIYRRGAEGTAVGVYCLLRRSLDHKDAATEEEKEAAREAEAVEWSQVESQLRRILLGAVASLNLNDDEMAKYYASATDQEIMRGAMSVADAKHHISCFFRSLRSANDRPLAEDLPNDEAVIDFIDLNETGPLDNDANDRLLDLKIRLRERLGKHVYEYNALWLGESGLLMTPDHIGTLPLDLDECLKLLENEQAPSRLCVDAWRRLARVILEEIAQIEGVSAVQREKEEHERFGAKRARHFRGRARYLDAIQEYVNARDQHPFALWGESGSGKSALLAHAAEQLHETRPSAALVIRFIGATPQSSDIRALLESLCHEISDLYGTERETIPADYNALIKEFHKRLSLATEQKPLVLVLDAVDQLSDAEQGRNLIWLPTSLPENVRLIVSTVRGQCLKVLQRKLPPERVLYLEAMASSEGREVLDLWLRDAGRTLQENQHREVLNKFAANGLPLYLKLAFEEARLWHSYGGVSSLAADVPGLIGNLFERLSEEANHGAAMVSRSLGYLAAARNGLTEDEILGVLSSDEEVKSAFVRRSPKSPEADALPVVVWSRLHFDLEPYLTERSADNTSLLSFYHRQLGAVAAQKYLGGADKEHAHQHLADYFGKQDYWLESPEQYRNRAAESPASARRSNLRKAVEFPWQLRKLGDWARLGQIHTDLNFLESKIAAGLVFELAQDFTEATRIMPSDQPLWRILDLLEEALRRDIHFIARHANEYPQAMFQCLWNSCWLYDSPQAAAHYEESVGPWLAPGPKLYELMEAWRATREEDYGDFYWVRSLRPPVVHLGTALRAFLPGHEGQVYSLAISSDGRRIVSSSGDGTVRVWDAETGAELLCLHGHDELVHSAVISSDGRRIVSGAWDQTIRVWDAESGDEVDCLRGHQGGVTSVAISTDGRKIVSGSFDSTVRVWDAENGEELLCLRGHEDMVRGVGISSDGRRIVSASGKTVRIWDGKSGAELRRLREQDGTVTSLALSADGGRIVSGAWDHTVRVCDAESGEELLCLRGHSEKVLSVAISTDGSRIVSGSEDETIRVWDSGSGKELRRLYVGEAWVESVAISPNGRKVVAGFVDPTIWVFDAERGDDVRHLRGHTEAVWSIAITVDGRRVVSGSADKTVRVWDALSGTELHCLSEYDGKGEMGLSISADGRTLVTASHDHTVRVWGVESGKELCCLRGHEGTVTSVAISTDGHTIASSSYDKTVRVWDAESGKELRCLHGHQDLVDLVAFSPDGRMIVSAAKDYTLRVWDTKSGEQLHCLRVQSPSGSIAISTDSRRFVSGSYNDMVRVWDMESGEEFSVPDSGDHSWLVGISPDGRRVSSSSRGYDPIVRVWDVETGECLEVIEGWGDVQAVVGGSPARAIARGVETVIEDTTGRPMAWFPVYVEFLTTHASGKLSTGNVHNHLYLLTLEGMPDQSH